MKQSSVMANATNVLGTFLQSMLDCAVAPTNASCFLVATKDWAWSVVLGASSKVERYEKTQ
jgi:hypothetical protein